MSTVTLENKTILVTGAAGFIGSNLVKRIYQEAPSATVIGIDNMNAYYDVALKEFRLNELAKYLRSTSHLWSLILRHRLVCATPSPTRMLMWNPTWSAFSIFLKHVAIARAWNIWFMLLLPPSTVPTRRFRTVQMIRLIIQFPFMQLPRNLMS